MLGRPISPSLTATAFHARSPGGFPYDIGDDPSFFSARHHHGPVTWGVCRHDVRGAIQPGDVMVFFSAEQKLATVDYRLVAVLCVDRKISQTSLFPPPAHQPFVDYLNLLVRPNRSGWEHFEPVSASANWHRDWLWQICDRSACARGGHSKASVVAAGIAHAPGAPLPFPVGLNYVVFCPANSIVFPNPPLVATHSTGSMAETWCSGSLPIRQVIFGSSTRGLRTGNPYQPHRHFRRLLVGGCPQFLVDMRSLVEA